MEQKKKIILVAGPTSSGKSNLGIKLANYFNGEIINADSMQVYKEISILTSKPNQKETQGIPHHLYGFNSVKEKFSTPFIKALATSVPIEPNPIIPTFILIFLKN